jgi:hypothetical protein
VAIDLTADYVITTDANSFFDTQIKLPEKAYTVTATNPVTGLVGRTIAAVVDRSNEHDHSHASRQRRPFD